MDSKAECVQLNLAHVARKNIKRNNKTDTRARYRSAHYQKYLIVC